MTYAKPLLCFLFFLPFLVQGQVDTSKVVVFKVKQKKFEVAVSPKDTIFWTHRINPITVRIDNGGKVDRVTVDHGRVFRIDSVRFEVRVRTGDVAVLSVYRKLPDGMSRLAYTQKYRVRSMPKPTVKICEVGRDGIVSPQHMISDGSLSAEIEGFEMEMPVEIESFSMIVVTRNSRDTLKAQGHRFTLSMRRKIHMLKSGDTIYFEDVLCKTNDGLWYMAEPVQVFIDESDRYIVGGKVFATGPE